MAVRIMLVEDELIVAIDMRQRLEAMGYEVIAHATSGEEAIKLSREANPDLILMDIKIQGVVDGIDTAGKIRELQNIPVIFLTAFADEATLKRALLTEAFGYLIKPFEDFELRSAIEIAIYKHMMDKALRESEERYRKLVETSPDGIAIMDLETRIITANQTNAEMWGYKNPLEMAGLRINNLIVPGDRSRTAEVLRDVAEGNKSTSIELRFLRKDGSFFFGELKAAGILDPNRQITSLIAITRDITVRKQAEKTLKESGELFQQIVERSSDVFYRQKIDSAGFEYVSPKITSLLGYSTKDFMKLDLEDQMEQIHPDDLPNLLNFKDELIAADNRGENHIERDFRLKNKQGEYRWIHGNYTLVRDNGNNPFMIVGSLSDITVRKQAEEALRKSEAFLKSIVDNIPLMVFVKDAEDLQFVTLNKAGEKIFGHNSDEIIGKNDHDLFTKEAADAYVAKDREVLQNQQLIDIPEETIQTRDFGERILHTKKIPLYNSEGIPQYLLGISEDITERKQAENIINEYTQRLEISMTAAAMAWWEMDISTGAVIFDKRKAEMLGHTPENFHHYKDFMTLVHPDDYDNAMNAMKGHFAGLVDKYETEYKIFTKSGEYKWFYDIGSIVKKDSNGVPLKVAGIVMDISERKRAENSLRESEARFKAVSEYSHNAICLINEAGKIIWVNTAFLQLGAYSNEQIYQATSFADFLAPESIEFVVSNFTKFVKNEPYEHHYSFYIVRSDGQKRLCEKHMTDYEDQFGKRILAISMVDVTELKQAEKDKEKLQEQFLQAQKMESVGRLAGGVAHDFNNSLGVILGHAERGLEKVSPEQTVYRDLEEILKAGQRSADLTRQLLAFARKQTVSPKVLDLNVTIASLFEMFQRLIGENIDLAWEPDPDLWHVLIDPTQVDQVLANLLVNARDAIGGEGKVVIETGNVVLDETTCGAHPGLTPGEYALLSVSDNGSGMDSEILAHLFEPFYTTKEIGKGTGLGLATIYGIVKQNNGLVEVSSEPGVGTTFRVYLPRVAAQADPILVPLVKAMEKPLGGMEMLLIVEDEEALLEMGKETLEDLGYTVLAACRPDEALQLAQEHNGEIKLLITDVVMPGMNGKALAEKLGAIQPGLKCLFMSGYTADIITDHGVLSEGVYFIQKPFTLNELAEKVRQALENR